MNGFTRDSDSGLGAIAQYQKDIEAYYRRLYAG